MGLSSISFVVILIAINVIDARDLTITAYENTSFNGYDCNGRIQRGKTVEIVLTDKKCTNIPYFNDLTSSIDPTECVEAWEHYDCQGQSKVMTMCDECFADLTKCGMNDKISAFRQCDCP